MEISEENISINDESKKKEKLSLKKHLSKLNEDVINSENHEEFIEKVVLDTKAGNETIPFDSTCSICKIKLTKNQFICVICTDCILCPKCEKTHIHPVLKCKNHQLSSLKDIFIYLNKRNKIVQSLIKNEKDSSVFGSLFSEKYEISIDTPSKEFSMRPNKRLNIPIVIQNLGNSKINCENLKLVLFGKNTKDLKIYEKPLNQIMNKREQIDVFVVVESNNCYGEYEFSIELYSTKNIKLKVNNLDFKICVNDNEDEEKLNEYFSKYPEILVMSKETKEGIKKIIENNNIKEDPITILQFLRNNNNNIEKTLENLHSLNDLNQNKIFQ